MLNNKVLKLLIIWFIMGMVYFTIEGIWRIPKGGEANIVMLPIGGMCGILVGGINQIPKFYNLKIWQQSLIGTIIVLIVEYFSGYILNIVFELGVWDYSNLPFNLDGQISLLFAVFWYILMPAAIWLEDYIRCVFWKENCGYGIFSIYKEFLFFR